ncbi:MAG TPA: vWA domain-containing protein [Kofleriaceae bacterium]
MRLAVASVLFAACASPGITTYSDNDPPIENGGSGGSCVATAFMVTPVTPYIELVVDGSQSMATLNLSDGTNKYNDVQKALLQTGTGLLINFQNKALFGAAVYTFESTCPKLYSTPFMPSNIAGVTTALTNGHNANHLYDPLEKALTAIVATLNAAPAGSHKVIILATDGVANSCGNNMDDATPSVTLLTNAYNNNQIKSYTIGFGDDGGDNNWTPFLTSMANAGVGGAGTKYNAMSLADVTADYTSIFNAVLDCEMTLDGTIDPAQASLGTVKSSGTTLTYTTDWKALDTHTIQLVGKACTDFNNAPTVPEISATFTCGSSH